MKKSLMWIIGIILVIAIIDVVWYSNQIKEDTKAIEIGAVFHLTGPGAFWGNGEYNGVKMAVEEINSNGGINGKELKIIIEDGQTDFPKTVNAIQKLSNLDNSKIIIGPTWFSQAASPLAKQNKVIIISPSGGVVPSPNEYFFDVWPTEKQEVTPTVEYMKNNNVKKVVIVYSLNEWSQSIRDNFISECEMRGIIVVKEFQTNPDEKDFKTIIEQIKKLNPDAVYAPFAFYPSQGAFSKQLKESGYNAILYSSSGTENPVLLQSFPEIEGTIYPYPKKSIKEEEFRKNYEEKFKTPMSPAAAYAYDCVYLIAEALKNGKTTPEEISGYLHSIDYEGVSNYISFDENGRVNQKEHIMKVVRNGTFIELE